MDNLSLCCICRTTTDHKERDCPLRCTICRHYHTLNEHKCMICKMKGADSHIESDCPLRCSICCCYHTTEFHIQHFGNKLSDNN